MCVCFLLLRNFSTHDHLNEGSTSFWALRLYVWLDPTEINRLAGGPLVYIDDILTCWLEMSCGVVSCGDEDLNEEKGLQIEIYDIYWNK